MRGEITKIDTIKNSRNYGDLFIRVHFKLEDGGWAKTDLVPGFRNYRRWKKFLRVGNTVFNLRLKDDKTVDADSNVYFYEGRRATTFDLETLSKLGAFG